MMDLEPIRSFLLQYGVCIVRLTAACSIVPFMSNQMLPGRLRNSILFALGITVYPIVAPTLDLSGETSVDIVAIIVKEIVIGILIGFVAAKVFFVALGVGFFIDNQRGASMASAMDPASGEQTSPLGNFLNQAVICLFYTSGGFLAFMTLMFESYVIWPVDEYFPSFNDAYPSFFLGVVDDLMATIVLFAAPVVITVFVSEFGLGLMNRFAPQMNVFSLSMPVKSLVAMTVLIFYLPFLMYYFGEKSQQSRGSLALFESFLQ
ncbi:MAG: type III secretion system export apparatus subunit SctT [Planctomycetota bacterium]